MAARDGGQQRLLGIDARGIGEGYPHHARRGRGGHVRPAVEAPTMRAAVAAVDESLVGLARPADRDDIFGHGRPPVDVGGEPTAGAPRTQAFDLPSPSITGKVRETGEAAMRRVAGLMLTMIAAGLAGCQSLGLGGSTPPPDAPTPDVSSAPAAYSVDKLIGSWGVASYREEKDRARTEAQAKAQCKLPYVIAQGPTDGVMMHVADDTTLHELALKRRRRQNLSRLCRTGGRRSRSRDPVDHRPRVRGALCRSRHEYALRHVRLRALRAKS